MAADSRPVLLRCRECGQVDAGQSGGPSQYCAECFGPLDLTVDWNARPPGSPDELGRVPGSLWRYDALLAVDGIGVAAVLAPGWTPLIRAERLGAALGLDDLWIKDETANPTGSFKDRLVATALAHALVDGPRVVACASTGNLARSSLAAAGRLGLDAVVLVPADLDEAGRDAGLRGAIRVDGGYDGINRLSVEAAMVYEEWAWVNIGLRPWYLEGAATLAYEIAEQLKWQLPRHVVAPIASGASLLRMHRAFADLAAIGWVEPGPAVAISPAQPSGCAPVAAAFAAGAEELRPVRPQTRAHSLAMGDPPDGHDLLSVVRSTGGGAEAVAERDIDAGVALLAETEGIGAEPAGGVAVVALRQLVAAKVVERSDRVVLCVTGGKPRRPAATKRLADSVGPPASIEPVVAALATVLPEHLRQP